MLADGHHRVEARHIVHTLHPVRRFPATIDAIVWLGDFRDAIRLTCSHDLKVTDDNIDHAGRRAVGTGC